MKSKTNDILIIAGLYILYFIFLVLGFVVGYFSIIGYKAVFRL